MELPTKLKDNEYLLKKRFTEDHAEYPTGFLSKYTQKGEVPKSFDEWGLIYYIPKEKQEKLPIILHTEDFMYGWKLLRWRFGQSQNWAVMIHPKGFLLEIYLKNFLEICKETVISYGVLEGEYKWEANNLIKKK